MIEVIVSREELNRRLTGHGIVKYDIGIMVHQDVIRIVTEVQIRTCVIDNA